MGKKIAIFGGKFDPPGMHHLLVPRYLNLLSFDEIIIVPSGPRPDRPELVHPVERAVMVGLTFVNISCVCFDFFDLAEERFTPTCFVPKKLALKDAELWFVIGSDLIQGGAKHEAKIQSWVNGKDVWSLFNFVVIERAEFPFKDDDIPPNSKVLRVNATGSSTEIRKRIKEGRPIHGLVVPEVEQYIKKLHLYRGEASVGEK